MSLYKAILNPFTGELQLIPSNTALNFQPAVANAAALPPSGNTLNDARITTDDGHLWIWNGSTWLDQGNFVDVTWDSLIGKPSSSPSDIDDAVAKRHVQNTDTKLDNGNPNEVTAAELRSHVDSTSNPHNTTKAQVGLGNVSNDLQLKDADKDTDGTLAANSDTKIPSQKAVKTYADTGLALKENLANKSNDTTLAADSATLYPTQHATKSYADTKVSSADVEDSGVSITTDGTLSGNSDTRVPTEKAVKTYADTKVGATEISDSGVSISTDGTFASNSDAKVPTEKATKTYTDTGLATKVPNTRTVNGHALSADVIVTKADVGLGNVTNDAQVKASDRIRGTFTNTSLSSGILTITHSFGLVGNFACNLTLLDNNDEEILPDLATYTANTIIVDLSSFGVLAGTWKYILIG